VHEIHVLPKALELSRSSPIVVSVGAVNAERSMRHAAPAQLERLDHAPRTRELDGGTRADDVHDNALLDQAFDLVKRRRRDARLAEHVGEAVENAHG
jgi:hypothetical protein